MAPAPAPAQKRRKTSQGFGSTKAKGIRKQQPVEELKFDPDARQEYLTGFHKRKVQRIKHAQEQAAKLAKEEKLEHRKEIREERKQDLERHVAEVNMLLRQNNPDISDAEEDANDSDEEGVEWGGIEEQPKPDGVDEYVDEDKFTTVTIETMDADPKKWNGDDEDEEKVVVVEEEKDGDDKKKRVWTKEKPKRAPKVKKPKFRYESKAERQQTRNKQRQKNQKAAAARKGDE